VLEDAVNNTIYPKYEQLSAQQYRVDYRMQEIQTATQIIERDIKTTYGAILERLKSAEGKKLAILQHDCSELKRDMNRIESVLKDMEEIRTIPDENEQSMRFLQ
jgi:hypothetical protein